MRTVLWIVAALLLPAGVAFLIMRRGRSRSGSTQASPSDGGHGPWMPSDFGENLHDNPGHGAGSETGAGGAGGGAGGSSDGGGD